MQLDLTIDVLLINSALPGAPEFIAAAHRAQPDIRVISIQSSESPSFHIPGVHSALLKPDHFGGVDIEDWVYSIERALPNAAPEAMARAR